WHLTGASPGGPPSPMRRCPLPLAGLRSFRAVAPSPSHSSIAMPLSVPVGYPSLLIRKEAFERAGLTRAAFDERLGLTDEEFRVERGLVVVGPIFEEASFQSVIE